MRKSGIVVRDRGSTASAAYRNLGDAKVDQLCNAILVHDVIGLKVTMSMRFSQLGSIWLVRVQVDEGTAYIHNNAQLLVVAQRQLPAAMNRQVCERALQSLHHDPAWRILLRINNAAESAHNVWMLE